MYRGSELQTWRWTEPVEVTVRYDVVTIRYSEDLDGSRQEGSLCWEDLEVLVGYGEVTVRYRGLGILVREQCYRLGSRHIKKMITV